MTLQKVINSVIYPKERQQRDSLLALQKQRPLTDAEMRDITILIDSIELANAKQWEQFAEVRQEFLSWDWAGEDAWKLIEEMEHTDGVLPETFA